MDKVKQGHGTKEFVPLHSSTLHLHAKPEFLESIYFLEYNLKNKSTHWEEMKWEIVFI